MALPPASRVGVPRGREAAPTVRCIPTPRALCCAVVLGHVTLITVAVKAVGPAVVPAVLTVCVVVAIVVVAAVPMVSVVAPAAAAASAAGRVRNVDGVAVLTRHEPCCEPSVLQPVVLAMGDAPAAALCCAAMRCSVPRRIVLRHAVLGRAASQQAPGYRR